MKAVIVEIRDGVAAALSDDGSIEKVQNCNYAIGQVIEMKKETVLKTNRLTKWAVSAVAAFLLVCGLGSWAYATPYSYVSLDVNPSIEYTLNWFDRVLSIKAVNDDGEDILKEIQLSNLNNKSVAEALILTINQMAEKGYFDGDIKGGIVITASSTNQIKAQELLDGLQRRAGEEAAKSGNDVEVEAVSVGLERVKKARELGVTPGKLNLVEKLKASAADPDSINIQEWLNKPVKEIMLAIKQNKLAAQADEQTVPGQDKTEDSVLDDDDDIDDDDDDDDDDIDDDDDDDDAQKQALKKAEKAKEKAIKAEEKAKETAAKVQEKAKEEAEKAAEKAKEEAEKAKKKAEKAAEQAKEEAEEAAEKAKEKAEKEREKAEKEAEKAEKAKDKPENGNHKTEDKTEERKKDEDKSSDRDDDDDKDDDEKED